MVKKGPRPSCYHIATMTSPLSKCLTAASAGSCNYIRGGIGTIHVRFDLCSIRGFNNSLLEGISWSPLTSWWKVQWWNNLWNMKLIQGSNRRIGLSIKYNKHLLCKAQVKTTQTPNKQKTLNKNTGANMQLSSLSYEVSFSHRKEHCIFFLSYVKKECDCCCLEFMWFLCGNRQP